MTYTSKALPALTALALILGTTALTAPAFASATECLKDDVQEGGQGSGTVPQVMTDIPLDDVKAPEQSSGWFFGLFGGSKPAAPVDVKTEEKPVQPTKSSGWSLFSWGSSNDESKVVEEGVVQGSGALSLPMVTPMSTPTSSLPGSTVETSTDGSAEELARLKAQLERYAKSKGRNFDDLSQSIFASKDDVNALTQHLAQTSLGDTIEFDNAGDLLRVVVDVNSIGMPIHSDLFYFVEHKNKRQLHKTWFSGSSIHSKLLEAPEKKFTFLKVTRENHESTPALWQAK